MRLWILDDMTQKPSVGRIVHFHYNQDGKRQTRPAIVVDVLDDDGTVKLMVFHDPSCDEVGGLFQTATYSDERGRHKGDEFEADGKKQTQRKSDGPCWGWPARVGAPV